MSKANEDGHIEIIPASVVKAFIAAGADVNAQGSDKDTPLDLASRKGHTEIIKLLQEAEGK